MKFQEHGAHTTTIVNEMIVSEASGSLNEEAIDEYIHEVDIARGQFTNKPYTWLLDLRNVEGATPEAWTKAEAHNKMLLGDTMLFRKAIVTHSPTNQFFAEKINNLLNEKVKVFGNLEEAKAWLRQKGD